MPSAPLAYFLTWTTHGSWLHGDERGSIDRHTSGPTLLRRDDFLARFERREMGAMYVPKTDSTMRTAIERAVAEVCQVRGWTLIALNVRTTHIHAVVSAPGTAPERVLNDFKTWSTRSLRSLGLVGVRTKLWTRHGSTRYLWREEDVLRVRDYVLYHQGTELPGTAFDPPDIDS